MKKKELYLDKKAVSDAAKKEKETWRQKQKELKEIMHNSEKYNGFIEKLNAVNEKSLFKVMVKERWGQGKNFYNLFWWDLEVNSSYFKNDLYKEYKDILLLPHRISLSELPEMVEKKEDNIWVVNQNGWGRENPFPHIDYLTGNIHIEMDYEKWLEDPRIEQVVLVTNENNEHKGPRFGFAKGEEDLPFENNFDRSNFIVFKGKDSTKGISKISIPKKCYYPGLEADNKNETIEIERMLGNLLKGVKED